MANYYEQEELWNRKLTPQEEERIEIVKNYIPDNVKTLLDAGCGNGAISNYLDGFDITAMDRSKEALKYVRNNAIEGSLDNLPFDDNSFDMVMCSDVLEHLPTDIYNKAIQEFKRVSKKYILIISPNSEDLVANQSKCIKCDTVFHMNWHISSISIEKIINNFRDDFSPIYYNYFGEKWSSEPPLKYTLARNSNRGYKHWGNAVCPMCNTQQKTKTENTKDIDIQCNRSLNGFYNKSTEFIVLLSTIENKKDIFDFDTIENKNIILSKNKIDKLMYVNRQFILTNNNLFTKKHTEAYPQYAYILDIQEQNTTESHKLFCFPYLQNNNKLHIAYKDSINAIIQINVYDLERNYINLGTIKFVGDDTSKTYSFDIPNDIVSANEGLMFDIVYNTDNIVFEDLKLEKIYLNNNFGSIEKNEIDEVEFLNQTYTRYEYDDFNHSNGAFLAINNNNVLIYDKEFKCFYMNLSDLYEFSDSKNKVLKLLNEHKEEISNLQQNTHDEISKLKQSIHDEISNLQQSTHHQISKLQQSTHDEISKLTKSTHDEVSKLQQNTYVELYEIKAILYSISNHLDKQSIHYRAKTLIKKIYNLPKKIKYTLSNKFISEKEKPILFKKKYLNLKHLVVITPDVKVDRRTVQMCQSLIKEFGIRCTIIAALEEKDDFITDTLKVKRINPNKVRKYIGTHDEWCDNTGIDLEEFYWLHPQYLHSALEEDADYIMCCDLPVLPAAVYVSKIKNIPLIYDAHELYPEQAIFPKEKREFYTQVETEFIKYPDLVITVNKSIAEEMAKRYHINEPEVILNALDASSVFDINKKYDYFRDKLSIKQNQKIVLFQGGYSPNRNLHLFVQSAKYIQNKDVVLVLMGFGDYERELQQIAKDEKTLNKNVFFFPAVDQSVLLEYSASADVGIIPYPHIDLNSYYCTPNKLFEFIQAGLPIIANDSPELNRFVKENSIGYSKKIEDEKDVANMIDTYFEQNIDYRENILKARKSISWSVEEKKFIEKMQEVI